MTTPTPDRPPLWRVMCQAYDQAPPAPPDAADDWTDRHGYAAEIRAIAMAIPSEVFGAAGVRLWLLEESNRAERGDG